MTSRLLVVLLLTAITAARAVVNPTPLPLLTEIEGLWKGQLRYRDYSKPDEFVTLPTTLAIAMSAPDEIELHFTYDEGRGRFVSSYERIQFDLAHSELHWSGATPDDNYRGQISARTEEDNATCFVVTRETTDDGRKVFLRYRIELAADRITMSKEDGDSPDTLTFRNEYQLRREK